MTVPFVNPGPAGVELNFPYPVPVDPSLVNVGAAAGAAATLALPADPSPLHLAQVEWSYTSAPTGGRLTITGSVAGVVRDYDVTLGGPGQMSYGPPLVFGANEAVTITLAGAGGATGKVACIAWRLK